MKALSIRQPWAWLIANGHKDIENRSWNTNYRGAFLIHASCGFKRAEYHRACVMAEKIGITIPPASKLEYGGIVGVAELTDCVSESKSEWYEGMKGFVIANARPLPLLPFKGQLSFFETGMNYACTASVQR